MKYIIISTIIAIFASALFIYLLNTISPFNDAVIENYIDKFSIDNGSEFNQFIDESIKAGVILDYLDLKNVMILHVILFISLTSTLATIHMVIDKIFFKKFFESPDWTSSVRRSAIIPAVLFLINFFRVLGAFGLFYIFIILLIVIILVLIEISFSNRMSSKKHLEDLGVKQ